jgi:hypothetical protein
MASRKEQKEALRAQRLAAERAATAAEGRRKMIAYGAGGLLAVGALVGLAAVFLGGVGQGSGTGQRSGTTPAAGEFPEGSLPPMRIADMGAAARAARCTSRGLPSEGADHVGGPVRYRSRPPHSGNHDQVPGEDAAYTEAPRRENLVHSLEHGRVVIWFSPDLAPEARGGLKALFDEEPYHMVLAPNRDMPAQVAASAWTQVLACGRMSPAAFDAIRAFRSRFRDRGPEFVP